jgi:elongation factor G
MDAPRKPFLGIEMKVEPMSADDQERMWSALATMAELDRNFAFSVDPESSETILQGIDELQLDNKIDRLRREFGVACNIGAPQVTYRETLAKQLVIDYTHRIVRAGVLEFARVKLRLEPNTRNTGNTFVDGMVGEHLPPACLVAVEKGVRQIWDQGVLIGYPMVDITVTLLGVDYDDDACSPVWFEIASRAALREGCEKAKVRLLEPIMRVVITTPPDFLSAILPELDRRCGVILEMQVSQSNSTIVVAHVPLAQMFGYINTLQPLSQGQATYSMTFGHLEFVPPNIGKGPDDFPPAVGMRA